jgi:hypothetical protein
VVFGGFTADFGYDFASGFFRESFAPFFSGFGAMQSNGTINIFFNDNPKNAEVMQPGQKVYTAKELGYSHCYVVTLDEITGKYQRNDCFTNSKVPTAMVRQAAVFGDEMYIIGKNEAVMGKTKLAVAKIKATN